MSPLSLRQALCLLAQRLAEAGLVVEDAERLEVIPDLAAALDRGLAPAGPSGELVVLPTYTAMLELRAELVRRGWARPFWED